MLKYRAIEYRKFHLEISCSSKVISVSIRSRNLYMPLVLRNRLFKNLIKWDFKTFNKQFRGTEMTKEK